MFAWKKKKKTCCYKVLQFFLMLRQLHFSFIQRLHTQLKTILEFHISTKKNKYHWWIDCRKSSYAEHCCLSSWIAMKPCVLFILDCRWCGPAPIGLGVPSTGVQICMCLVLSGNRPPYWSATTPSSKTKHKWSFTQPSYLVLKL